MEEKVIKKLPTRERLWLTYTTENQEFYITSNVERTTYFAYQKIDGGYLKIGKASDPTTLETKFIKKRMVK